MEKAALLFRYFSFLIRSGDEHSIHSPFVYDLYTRAIKPNRQFYSFQKIELLRRELLASKEEIIVKDLGAGSKVEKTLQRKVRSIAKNSEKSPRLAQLLFNLVEYFKPATIVDLGTSFGLTTIYMATPSSETIIYTFEGCPETVRIAQKNFSAMKLQNIQVVEGNIDETLPAQLQKLSRLDFVFFDANHRYEPTIRYYKECLKKAHEDTVFVFDDIHWSEEMEKAWEEICDDEKVTISIDLFNVGLVFFRKKQPKQHFVLRF